MMLEPGIGDGAEPVITVVQRLQHCAVDARIVESRQHHERPETHVAVAMAGHRVEERRHGE
jgi:hypothetical protein